MAMEGNMTSMDPNLTPALMIPGEVSDFSASAAERLGFIISAVVCLGVSSLFVFLRLYTKARILKEFLIDDYAIVIAWVGLGAWYGLNFATPANGKHQYDISYTELTTYLKFINAILILYCPIAFLSKLSILLQLQSIFTRQRNLVWHLCRISIYINLAFYVALLFLSIFQCVPRERIWDPLLGTGSCIPLVALIIPPSAVLILSDIWILSLPVIVMWRLHIPLARKLAIAASFSVGLISLVAAVMPLYYSAQFLQTEDETYAVYPIAMWAGVQLNTLVLAASLPTLPRLWAHIRGGDGPATYEQNSAVGRIASFRRKRRRDSLGYFPSATPDLTGFAGPETPFEIVKTTEVRVVSFRVDSTADIGLAV